MKNKKILITGGTGSFGTTMVRRLIQDDQFKEVVVFSRDEKKQHDLRIELDNPKVKFVIGDIRDIQGLRNSLRGIHYVFHAAALKHVPSCEFFPLEAIKTNCLGAENVMQASEDCGVEKVVILSTDKAVYPINSMGMSKALMEKLMMARARREDSKTVFCGVRYGNVMYSRGSVIPLFVKQIKEKKPVTITHPDMTRFLLALPTAIDLVLFALKKGAAGDLFVRKAPASTTHDIAKACLKIFDAKNPIKTIGIREGEKMHETLVSAEEMLASEDLGDFYKIRWKTGQDYERFLSRGSESKKMAGDYTSENTKRLTLNETQKLISQLEEIKNA